MSSHPQIDVTFNNSTKRLPRCPKSFSDLLSLIEAIFKMKNIKLKYQDDEGDLITLSTDHELQETLEFYSNIRPPVLKLIIEKDKNFQSTQDSDLEIDDSTVSTVRHLVRSEMEKALNLEIPKLPIWDTVTCDGCNEFPIAGNRFKCTVCDNFDLCQLCEMSQEHPHPFIKLTSKDHNIEMIKVALEKPGKNLTKAVLRKPKMKFLQHVNYIEGEKVRPGNPMQKTWKVKNIGNEEWPAGCIAGFVKGDLPGVGYEFGPVACGETVDVVARIDIPCTEGRYTGVWRLFTPDDISFGDKLYIVVQSLFDEDDVDPVQLEKLTGLGIDRAKAISALRACNNNIEDTFAYLFQN